MDISSGRRYTILLLPGSQPGMNPPPGSNGCPLPSSLTAIWHGQSLPATTETKHHHDQVLISHGGASGNTVIWTMAFYQLLGTIY